MNHPQSDGKRASRMRRGKRVLHLLAVEAQALADHLDELPTALAAIDALEDGVNRREAKVAVREALREFRTLHWRLQIVIAKLTALCDLQPNNPSVCVPTGTGETAMPRSKDGCAHDSA